MEHGPISFPDWKQVLTRAGFEPARRGSIAHEIVFFFPHCSVEERMDPARVETPQICLHVMKKPGPAGRSP